jgi:hypothetical protein
METISTNQIKITKFSGRSPDDILLIYSGVHSNTSYCYGDTAFTVCHPGLLRCCLDVNKSKHNFRLSDGDTARDRRRFQSWRLDTLVSMVFLQQLWDANLCYVFFVLLWRFSLYFILEGLSLLAVDQ